VTVSCPRCHTAFVFARRHAQTTAAAVGGAADTADGSCHPMEGIAGVALGGLIGCATGCAASSAIGALID
jgi:hypothetical protein